MTFVPCETEAFTAEHTAKGVRILHLSVLCSGGVHPRRRDPQSRYRRRQATPLRNDGSSRSRPEIYLGGTRPQCQQQLFLSSALLHVFARYDLFLSRPFVALTQAAKVSQHQDCQGTLVFTLCVPASPSTCFLPPAVRQLSPRKGRDGRPRSAQSAW